MLREKKMLPLTLLMVLMLVLAACAPDRGADTATNNGNDQTSEGEGAEKPELLKVWINDEDISEDIAVQMFDKYTEETGIKVEFEKISLKDQIQKLALAGPTGDGPDLFFLPQDRLGDAVAQGLAVPINYTDDELNGFSEAAIDAFTYEGEIFGAPVAIETYFLYYNKDIIDTPPATIEEAYEVAKQHTNKKEKKYGYLVEPGLYYLYPFIAANGGYVFGEKDGVYDPQDIGLDNEGSIKGLTQFQQFTKEGLIPKKLTTDVIDGLFSEGKVASVVSGPWNLPIYKDALGDSLGTAPLPKIAGEGAPSFVGVKAWLVSYYSENQEWAEDLAKFMTGDEMAKLHYDVTGELPPRPAVLDQIEDPIYAGYTEQVEYGTPMPNIPEMSTIWDFDDAIELIVKGDDVESVLKESVGHIREKIGVSTN